MDFNVNPMCCCYAQRVGEQLHIFDEEVIPNANTEIMARQIDQKYKNRTTIYPDPSGKSRRTSAPGQTDFTILENYGFSSCCAQ